MSYRMNPGLGAAATCYDTCQSSTALRACVDANSPGGNCARGLNGTGCKGLGCKGMGCGCAGTRGMGLFDAGTDFTQWGIPEWAIVGLGFYMVVSTLFTTSRAVGRVRALPGERRKKKAARLRAEASELTKKRKGGWF